MSSELSAGTTPGGANNAGFQQSPAAVGGEGSAETPRIPHIRIVPHIVDVRHCLYFDVMDRDVPENTVLKVGRFTEKVSQQMSRIAFKSKVVSRSHAEIWTEGGNFFIRDTKSSSGTFLNHLRLSPPGVESRPHQLHDGDVLQLGVDYQGGTLDIYKCVKIRLEINRNWQRSKENPFRRQVMENIQNAYHAIGNSATGADGGADDSNNECCICLYKMVAFQALFVAPCSHCFHFKCVKPILFTSTGFSCPLCRTYADLEADVNIDDNEMDVDAKPPQLPSSIHQHSQHSQPGPMAAGDNHVSNPSAAAAEAEAAVIAAETTGALRVPGTSSSGNGQQNSSVLMERDDANSTPVPQEQAAIDSFGTTPVGSMPTNLAHFNSLAAGVSGEGETPAAMQRQVQAPESMQVSSPASTDNNAGGEAGSGNQAGAACHPAVGAAAQGEGRAAPSGNSEA
ncbi:hypothetical protein FBU59_000075 [Linderina macrospora]|uniref:Uncharacterized protein n=1 Tax=Linderina macrospora TaxID=4868 RepID=A0ACC1JI39_9FUNG|nr:hypothetical protein FBU59_000075 [Linderina macrospora]